MQRGALASTAGTMFTFEPWRCALTPSPARAAAEPTQTLRSPTVLPQRLCAGATRRRAQQGRCSRARETGAARGHRLPRGRRRSGRRRYALRPCYRNGSARGRFGKKHSSDYVRVLRIFLYGGLYVTPAEYRMQQRLKAGLKMFRDHRNCEPKKFSENSENQSAEKVRNFRPTRVSPHVSV